jgi:hypothetical protein
MSEIPCDSGDLLCVLMVTGFAFPIRGHPRKSAVSPPGFAITPDHRDHQINRFSVHQW